MRVHSRILLQTCITDLAFLCLALIGTPVLIHNSSFSLLLLDGYFTRIFAASFNYSPMCLNILNFIYSTCFFFDIFSISAQFVYRYLLLKGNTKINLARYLLMLTLPFVASLTLATFFAFNLGETIELNDTQKAPLTDFIDWDSSIYYIIGGNNQRVLVSLCIVGMIISYSINIFCGLKVVKFVGAHAGFNPRMKELNRQLTKNLIILALFHCLTFLLTLLVVALYVSVKIHRLEMVISVIRFVQYFGSITLNWLPVANPIVGIWINTPYRDAVKQFVARLFKKSAIKVTTVQPFTQQL